ncbi:DUF1642 domain-containing protein [Enterococcus faecium]|nr:DUF1642 domain-containing protein [Enterococcus faecium]
MNKQELIDKWESKTGAPAYEISDFSINPSKNEMYIAGYGVARKEILEDLKQLDEQQKNVMPKFFDDWANRVIAKHDEFYAISLVARAGWGYGVDFELSENGSSSENKELLYWIVDKCNDNYPNKKKAIEALLYGYEVEKEPEYHVILSENTGGWKYTFLDEEGSIDRTNNKAHIPTFTEKKVKAIDERYWAFAVPVVEVAEG